MALHTLVKLVQTKKRRGRGIGGDGAKSGRGQKGAGSRAGAFSKAGFEGGQTPLYMRLPKGRGTKQRFAPQVSKPIAIPVRQLNVFAAGTIVGPAQLQAAELMSWRNKTVKIIGADAVKYALTVRVHHVTPGARSAIEAAGGKVEIIN